MTIGQVQRIALFPFVLSFGLSLAAQTDGAAMYKAKCAMCHGPTGTPSAGMAKAMGIKAISDPSMKALTITQIIATVKNGKGKMKPLSGLTDSQIEAIAVYFKSLK